MENLCHYFQAEQIVRLNNGAGSGMEWAMYNTQGQLLRQGQSDFAQAEVHVAALPAGMYVFELRDAESQTQQTKKVVKY